MYNSETKIKNLQSDRKLLHMASQVRQVTTASRNPGCMHAFLAYYEKKGRRPIYPRNHPRFPSIVVSSSNHLGFQHLYFPVKAGRDICPEYVELDVRVPRFLAQWGLSYNDILTTLSDGRGGFHVHGNCHTVMWETLVRFLG